MERVRLEDLEDAYGPATVKRRLTGALGTTDVALNYYELEPGDALAFGYHRHSAQEEVFVVESGTVTFETASGPVEVGAGEAARFEAGEFQRGVNQGTERTRVLAIGAPRESGETTILRDCATCDDRTPQAIERATDGPGLITRCLDCDGLTGRFLHGEVDPGTA